MKTQLDTIKRDHYISPGNQKLVGIPIWNLPARSTCPGSTPYCRQHCYAMKAERQYPDVRPCRKRNLHASMDADFAENMLLLLHPRSRAAEYGYMRIHESGDFYNQPYLDQWIRIAEARPNIKFLAYTKSFHLSWAHQPKNLITYWSVMPDSESVPEGNRAFAGACSGMRQAFHCVQGRKCHNCLRCWNHSGDVRFDIH